MVYYIETNLIAILIALILLFLGRRISSQNETSQMIMNRMLRLLILLSISDIAAYCFRGRSYIGVQLSNTLYFMAMALGAYAWFLYVIVKMEYSSDIKKTILKTSAPVVLLCGAIVLNPFTGFFFTVDAENLYHRGTGIIVTWIVEWGYMLAALAINIRAVIRERRSFRRSELQGYLIFALPIAVAAACQMLFYGTTTTQVGFMIGMLMAYLNKQHYQVQRDDLTGLNNKNAFLRYQDSIVNHPNAQELTAMVVDADNFKTINDVYGHLKGDQALKDIASALKSAVSTFTQNRVLLFRYGGDEFVIIGINLTEESIRMLCSLIHDNLEQTNERNRQAGEKYNLSVSIGAASRSCADLGDFADLMKAADTAMYQVKGAKKKTIDRRA